MSVGLMFHHVPLVQVVIWVEFVLVVVCEQIQREDSRHFLSLIVEGIATVEEKVLVVFWKI